jgi:hypothetical protein
MANLHGVYGQKMEGKPQGAGVRTGGLAALALSLLLVVLVFGGVPFLKGGFYIGKHEGDTMHLAELVLRMAAGEWPHLDFMTPIGVLAVAPMAQFVKLGAGLGHAIFLSQVMVALVLLPAVLRVAHSRLGGFWPFAYGAFVMILCVALVHGEAESSVSISMHYNRWAWAVAYILVPLALLEPKRGAEAPWLDGALIGVGLALLVLTKVTYFVALAPGIAVALLARRHGRQLLAAALAGLAVAAVVTAMAGVEFWLAYLGDLQTVSASEIRAKPGQAFGQVVGAPMYMGASLTLIAIVILLRQSGRMVEGMGLLFLMPGFFFIAYQNFGNDPQWLYLAAMLALVLLPAPGTVNGRGWDLREGMKMAGLLALAFGAPSALNLVYSPFRHLSTPTEGVTALIPALPATRDVFTRQERLYQVNRLDSLDEEGEVFATYRAKSKRDERAVLNGEVLPECGLDNGMNAWFETVVADLEGAGYGGSALMGTDLFSLYWAFGDFRRVKGAAPWYYGGLSGAENADYVVVPLCPMGGDLRQQILKGFADGGWTLTEVRRTELYVLVKPTAPARSE